MPPEQCPRPPQKVYKQADIDIVDSFASDLGGVRPSKDDLLSRKTKILEPQHDWGDDAQNKRRRVEKHAADFTSYQQTRARRGVAPASAFDVRFSQPAGDQAGCCSGFSLYRYQDVTNDDEPVESIAAKSTKDMDDCAAPEFTEKDTLSLLAREMNELSVNEREHITNDIHGLTEPILETEALLSNSLKKFQGEIDQIRQKSAYEDALRASPEFVQDPELRLMFLRAERFEAKLAAERCVRHFESKLQLFGKEKIAKRIDYNDLDEQDREVLLNGEAQYLPERDRAGRLVLQSACPFHPKSSIDSVLRVSFYLFTVASEDKESQRKGIVLIMYIMNERKYTPRDIQILWKGSLISFGYPVTSSAFHLCCKDIRYEKLGALLRGGSEKRHRLRMRYHMGNHMEVQYALMTFGIPVGNLFIDANGKLSNESHLKWVSQRRIQDENRSTKRTAPAPSSAGSLDQGSKTDNNGKTDKIIPREYDVLYGRGSTICNNPGNVKMLQYIDENHDQYAKAEKWKKATIAADIVQTIQDQNGRFLRKEAGRWVEVTNAEAREKICHSFRSLNKKKVRALDR